RVGARTILLGGFRVDRFNKLRRWIVSPRAGFKHSVTGNLNWRVSISTGFRAPEIFNEDLHVAQVGGEGFLIENSPGLREEKSVSLSAGLDYVGRVGRRPYRMGANFFWTDLRNNFQLIEVPSPVPGSRLLLRVNGPGSYVRGVDFDANVSLSPRLSLRGGATLQVARYKEPEEQFGSLSFFRSPERYGFFGLDWILPGRVELTSTTEFLGPMLVPHYAGYIPEDRLERTQSFVVVNAVVSKLLAVSDKARLRVFLNINNIADTYQPDLDRGPNRDSSYVYGPTQMRRVILGLTWEF
ncbi:MAG TPA: TonB-dependent receptor, partial [Bryobacterales bacterium]|nr:TonB-dependent receptor [Bryobacterales bacterium]